MHLFFVFGKPVQTIKRAIPFLVTHLPSAFC